MSTNSDSLDGRVLSDNLSLATGHTSEPDESSAVASTSNAALTPSTDLTPPEDSSSHTGAAAGEDHEGVGSGSISQIEGLELLYPDDDEEGNTLPPIQYPINASRASSAGMPTVSSFFSLAEVLLPRFV